MYGVGYPVLENGIEGRYAIGFLLVLLVGKMIATSLTIGIGGSGGVFAPSLFIGAMAGTAFGLAMQAAFPALDISPGAYGLVGMAAVFAGASHAPIAAVVIVFELTGQYSIILPLMAAVALATGASHLVSHKTIYTLKLLRRGVDIDADQTPDLLRTMTVAQAMRPVPDPVGPGTTAAEVARILGTSRYGAVPVRGPSGYLGAVLATDGDAPDGADVTAADRAVRLPTLRPDDSLHDAVSLLHEYETTGLPVVPADSPDPVGWLDHRDVLAAYASAPVPRVDAE